MRSAWDNWLEHGRQRMSTMGRVKEQLYDRDADLEYIEELERVYEEWDGGRCRPPEVTCEHEWINIGFTSEKYVCKICDVEKSEINT